jgi:hypothetical protein
VELHRGGAGGVPRRRATLAARTQRRPRLVLRASARHRASQPRSGSVPRRVLSPGSPHRSRGRSTELGRCQIRSGGSPSLTPTVHRSDRMIPVKVSIFIARPNRRFSRVTQGSSRRN